MADATTPPADGNGARRARCPICRAPTEAAFRPFCSKRCSDVDLSRWLTGTYAIAGGDSDADEDGDDAAAQGIRRNPQSEPE
ncbi:MAG: DNA gyrase inhibitor YacG [Hyphomicrobiaceae bacterium]